ncbi:MAG: dienelactone hydrolase family protein [Beijerinckiaceae bacterium]|nr:dienelactone hydrolase family protein [Beijerinckiaceae bacterium]
MNDMPRITQEMIDLYDHFTHVSTDKVAYLDKLTALVGSRAAAEAITSQIAANKMSAPIAAVDDPRLTIEKVTFGENMTSYLAKPKNASGKLPCVVVVHENRGLVPHIEDVARRVALEGFIALAPDFLQPLGGTPEDEDVGRDMIGKLDRAETVKNAVAAVAYLKKHSDGNGKVGAVGFCWGGGIVNAAAVASGDQLDACVAYYGAQPKADDVSKIKANMMLHYAGLDERINAGIDAFRAALEANKTPHEIFVYEGAQHAFNNDTTEARYHKEAADLAWSRTISLFKKTLG